MGFTDAGCVEGWLLRCALLQAVPKGKPEKQACAVHQTWAFLASAAASRSSHLTSISLTALSF